MEEEISRGKLVLAALVTFFVIWVIYHYGPDLPKGPPQRTRRPFLLSPV